MTMMGTALGTVSVGMVLLRIAGLFCMFIKGDNFFLVKEQ